MASNVSLYLHELLDHGEYEWSPNQRDALYNVAVSRHLPEGSKEYIRMALFEAIESGAYSYDNFKKACYVYAYIIEWLLFPLSCGGENTTLSEVNHRRGYES